MPFLQVNAQINILLKNTGNTKCYIQSMVTDGKKNTCLIAVFGTVRGISHLFIQVGYIL